MGSNTQARVEHDSLPHHTSRIWEYWQAQGCGGRGHDVRWTDKHA